MFWLLLEPDLGKTAVLVERILNKIINDGIDVDKLLVVTFTNSAAQEMRERLADRLHSELDSKPHLINQIKLLSKASVTTIDSFCLKVVKDNFFKLDLDPNFRIGDKSECELLKLEALEELLENKYEENNEEFLNIFNMYSSNKDDENLRGLILKIYNFTRSCTYPNEWLNNMVNHFDLTNCDDSNAFITNSIYGKIVLGYANKQIENSISELDLLVEDLSDSDLAGKYIDVLQQDIFNLHELQKCIVSWNDFYSAISNFSFTRAPSVKGIPDEIKEQISLVRDSIKETIYEKLKKKIFIVDSNEIIRDYKDLYNTLSVLKELVIDFDRLYFSKKVEKNILDFSDVSHFALKLLTSYPEVSNLYKEKYEEILIDEYQDSNQIQESIMQAISNNKMFMVGDVKQSIYKFRQARPEIFLKKYNDYELVTDIPSDSLYKKILLFKNFRSNENIINQINFIFEKLMSKEFGDIDYNIDEFLKFGASYYEQIGEKAELCLIETDTSNVSDDIDDDVILDSNGNIEGRYIANRIKEIVGNMSIYDKSTGTNRKATYKDIVILMRTTVGRIDSILEELSNQNIPVYSDNGGDYFNNTEVQIILSLLSIIDNPLQDIPLVAVLKSQIGGFSIDELSSIRLCDRKGYFYNAMIKALNLENDLSNKVRVFLDKLLSWREKSKYLSLWELINLLYNETGYYYYVSLFPDGYKRQLNLKLLLERAEKFENTSFKGLFNFLNFIENIKGDSSDFGESKPIGEDQDVVRIMSVHKSKGLEFPIVFLAATDKRTNKRDLSDNIIMDEDIGFGMDVIDYDDRIKYPNLSKHAIKIKLQHDRLSEELRILYVALTRAREKLIVTGLVKDLSKTYKEYSSKISKFKIENSKNLLDWIGYSVVNKISDWIVNKVEVSSLINQENINDSKAVSDVTTPINPISEEDVNSQMNWIYKYDISTNIPSKVSISELKRRRAIFDDENINLIDDRKMELIQKPSFLEENQETGAKYGTSLHSVMQKIDFVNCSKELLVSLVNNNCDESIRNSILNKVEMFLNTELYEDIKNAKSISRETAFNLNIKAKEIYNVDSDDNVMIQGIIDLFYINQNDELILVDYKTDNVDNKEELISRYRVQLELYKRALEEILDKKVSKTIIYSFKLNETIFM